MVSVSSSKFSSGGKKKSALFPRKVTIKGRALIMILSLIVLIYTFIALFGEILFLFPNTKANWCESYDPRYDFSKYGIELGDDQRGLSSGDGGFTSSTNSTEKEYENPDYITDPCRYERLPRLCFLTIEECDLSRRMLASVFLGGAIGYERRASDRPAGIRTMGLVSLGSCFFTISSQLAFKSSTMGWDSSRVTAAIPSGVGFLGAGLIWKGTVGIGEAEVHQVHGLTTAASVWLSAAVGVGCGGALYFPTAYATILVLMVLRYGPKLYLLDDSSSIEDEDEDDEDDDDMSLTEDESSDTHMKQSVQRSVSFEVTKDTKMEKDLKEDMSPLLAEKSRTTRKSVVASVQKYDSFQNSDAKKESSGLHGDNGTKASSSQGVEPRFDDLPISESEPSAISKEESRRKKYLANKKKAPSFHS